jgi:hypothetical protein
MFNLRAIFHKKRAEQEMDDELRFHLERQTEQNIARGMSPKDARYAALALILCGPDKEDVLRRNPRKGCRIRPDRGQEENPEQGRGAPGAFIGD